MVFDRLKVSEILGFSAVIIPLKFEKLTDFSSSISHNRLDDSV